MKYRRSKLKKKHYTELSSTHKCKICKKPIKQRLIDIKTVKPTLCYKHYILQESIKKYSPREFVESRIKAIDTVRKAVKKIKENNND